MPAAEGAIWRDVFEAAPLKDRFLADARRRVWLRDLAAGTRLGGEPERFRGKAVLVHLADQMSTALAILELDGLAKSLILCPPGLSDAQLGAIVADTQPDEVLTDRQAAPAPAGPRVSYYGGGEPAEAGGVLRNMRSNWLLFTSGTTGRPKAVVHDLASLTAPLRRSGQFPAAVWSTFYDIRRYGGLTILLRALLTGGSMVFSECGEPVSRFLARAGAFGVTHVSGTPSHWRQALMSGGADGFRPDYVRMSGEPADQAIIDALQAAFPVARVSHAFASTEAGVAFDVRDGKAGFPAGLLEHNDTGVALKIADDTLRIRSAATAARYWRDDLTLRDENGFVDTGDVVALRDGRYHFVGRREGLINVGGLKVHPEEVEAVINQHPAVHMSLVRGRKSPITGALVVADVVIRDDSSDEDARFEVIRGEILARCRDMLPAHKVPSQVRRVTALDLAASGKLLRAHV